MPIVWSGWGLLAIAIPYAVLLSSKSILDSYLGTGWFGTHNWAIGIALLTSASVSWVVGTFLNSRPAKEVLDKRTGKSSLVRPNHTLFFMPLEFSGVVPAIFSIFYFFNLI